MPSEPTSITPYFYLLRPISYLLSPMPLIGNKVAEKDLRDWLEANGYYGRSAEIAELELAAIERPGWVQVFRFAARAKRRDGGGWDDLRGFLRDDERHRTEVRLAATDAERAALFADWSRGLIVSRPGRGRGAVETALILLCVVILSLAAAVAAFGN